MIFPLRHASIPAFCWKAKGTFFSCVYKGLPPSLKIINATDRRPSGQKFAIRVAAPKAIAPANDDVSRRVKTDVW
jgi:hypothetical protein